jgi:hypothetical protein
LCHEDRLGEDPNVLPAPSGFGEAKPESTIEEDEKKTKKVDTVARIPGDEITPL